jgi:hypothetical protein
MGMKKVLLIIGLIAAMLMSTGCSETIPQGTKGKILGSSGFQPEVYPPSRTWVGWRENLIFVETVTHTVNETVTVRMKDDLNLIVQVRFQLRMGEQENSLDAVFNDIKPKDGYDTITLKQVYDIYGKMITNKVTREVLSEYNIGDVNDNFNHISADIYSKILEAFKPTPLIISDVALGKLDYPDVIDNAIMGAAKRELEIKQAEADVQVRLTELKGKEQVAKGEYRIKMEEARRIKDYNAAIAEGITPELLELRKLEVQQELVNAIGKGDTTTIFVPYSALGTTGLQNRIMLTGKDQ